eukprot:jgi/Ulvmu1/9737/UM055_0077.1
MAQSQSGHTHFARVLVGPNTVIGSSFAQRAAAMASRGIASSSAAHAGVGLPTLGNTNMKFNSSRWTRSAEAEGLSIFDMKGAMSAIQDGPDDAAKKRAHPAAIAHAARVARAQQMGASWFGYKLFPDLTPGRAFMWGSILALYAVGASAVLTARACDISSVDEIKVKMQAAFAPYKAALTETGCATRGSMELQKSPEALQTMSAFGQNLRRALAN